jgi:hypothetical protein
MQRKCINCHKNYNAKTKRSAYCSEKCGAAFRRKKIKEGNKKLRGLGLTQVGRKRFHTPLELKEALDEYFLKKESEITPAGLLLHLGINRKIWDIYENKATLRKFCEEAKLRMEHIGTKRLYKRGRVADIFFMKNMGWSDKTEVVNDNYLTVKERINDEQARKILRRFAQKRTGGSDSK